MTTSSSESLSHAKWDGKHHGVVIPKAGSKRCIARAGACMGRGCVSGLGRAGARA